MSAISAHFCIFFAYKFLITLLFAHSDLRLSNASILLHKAERSSFDHLCQQVHIKCRDKCGIISPHFGFMSDENVAGRIWLNSVQMCRLEAEQKRLAEDILVYSRLQEQHKHHRHLRRYVWLASISSQPFAKFHYKNVANKFCCIPNYARLEDV